MSDFESRIRQVNSTALPRLPHEVARAFNDYGETRIESISLHRSPVPEFIYRSINYASDGKIGEELAKQAIEKPHHVWINVKLVNGKYIKLHKEHTIRAEVSNDMPDVGSDSYEVALEGKSITLRQLHAGAQQKAGIESILNYDPACSNCQNYVKNLLGESGLLKAEHSAVLNESVGSALSPELRSNINKLVTGIQFFTPDRNKKKLAEFGKSTLRSVLGMAKGQALAFGKREINKPLQPYGITI